MMIFTLFQLTIQMKHNSMTFQKYFFQNFQNIVSKNFKIFFQKFSIYFFSKYFFQNFLNISFKNFLNIFQNFSKYFFHKFTNIFSKIFKRFFQKISNIFSNFFKYYFKTVWNIIQFLIENSSVNISHYSFLTPYSLLLAPCSLLLILYSWTFYSSQNPLSSSLTLEQLYLVFHFKLNWQFLF